MLKILKRSTLISVAVGGLVVGSGVVWYSQRIVQNKVKSLPHYKECFDIVSKHEKALNLLGKPIQVGQVNLADRKNNFVGKETSQLRIPISGALNSGFLNVSAKRVLSLDNEKDKNIAVGIKALDEGKFVTKSIELEMEDQTILLYEKK